MVPRQQRVVGVKMMQRVPSEFLVRTDLAVVAIASQSIVEVNSRQCMSVVSRYQHHMERKETHNTSTSLTGNNEKRQQHPAVQMVYTSHLFSIRIRGKGVVIVRNTSNILEPIRR
jgi:hypothetical protein